MSAESDRKEHPSLRQRMADGGWPLFALEALILAVVFGWLFVTVALAGGNGPW